jgi:hypothetical protein
MDDYVVISKRILTGTMRDLPPAAWRAWIAVLFEAERLRGRVKLPVSDLALLAAITRPEAAEALRLFQEPDPWSSSKVGDGRRLVPVNGEEDWYQVVTWEKHWEERERFFARLRQQRKRAAGRRKNSGNGDPLQTANSHGTPLQNGEASRSVTNEPELEPESRSKASSAEPTVFVASAGEKDAWFEERWVRYPNKEGKKEARRHFVSTVKTHGDLGLFDRALENYLLYLQRDRKRFGRQPKNGSTFFNDWQSEKWENPPPNEPSGRRRPEGLEGVEL